MCSTLVPVQVYEDASIPVYFSARTDIVFFDENIIIGCFDQCEGPATGSEVSGAKLRFFTKNVAVASAADLMVSFGDDVVLDLTMLSSDANTSTTNFFVSIPACSLCTFTSGVATVQLSVAFVADKVQLASTAFRYFSAPTFSSIRFTTTGTTIDCTFDQATDRAGMTAENANCSDVLSDETVARIGAGARCVWPSDDILSVFLGDSPILEPNDPFALRPGALKAYHKKSPFSSAIGAVARPLVIKQPEIFVKGVDTIDPCSSLEIRVSALSPRPVQYSWSCINDVEFNSYLATVSSSTLYLAPGTSQMVTFPKEYVLEISVTDFLGVASAAKRFNVLKKATASPQMEFNPPTVETLRNVPVFIKGETIFSACPVEETELAFSWRQVSGPRLPASLLSATMPQLLIPPDTLPAGSVLQLALKASMADVSQSSESVVLIKVGYQQLIARMKGASRISTFSQLYLSAEDSRDPDLDASALQELSFTWECSFIEDGLQNICRDPSGNTLALPTGSPTHPTLIIDPGVLPPRNGGYIFSVSVQKGSRSSSAASMQVDIVSENIPTVSIDVPMDANVAVDGAMIINREDRIIFHAASSTSNTSYMWSMQPDVNISLSSISPLGVRSQTFIFEGRFAQLQVGSRYRLLLQGTTSEGSVGAGSLELLINSGPLGGSFSACLIDPNQAQPETCIKTGEAVTEDFRLLASSWTDPDLPLHYEFGYMLNESSVPGVAIAIGVPSANSSNGSNASEAAASPNAGQIWFDPVRDNVRDMAFPRGEIIVMCRILDALGAATDLLTDRISATSSIVTIGAGGRRLLATDDFFAKAKSKLSGALKTFRADKVNQMANSVAVHADSGGLGPTDSSSMKGALMASLQEGTGKAVKTTGFACESFGAAKSVTSNAGQVWNNLSFNDPETYVSTFVVRKLTSSPCLCLHARFCPLLCCSSMVVQFRRLPVC